MAVPRRGARKIKHMYVQQEQRPPLAKRIIWHPFLIGFAFIFHFWASAAVHPLDAMRVLAAGLLGTLLLMYLFRLGLRSWRVAGVATSAVWALLISQPALRAVSRAALDAGAWRAIILTLLLMGLAFFLVRGLRRYLRRSQALSVITRGLNGFSFVLVLIVVAQSIIGGNLQTPMRDVGQVVNQFMTKPPSVGSRVPAGPDIYVFVLDAYAGAETLERYGFDNSPFLTALEQRGFDVASQSRTNYYGTYLTLASMLNMMPIQDLPQWTEAQEGNNGLASAFRDAINRNRIFEDLYDYGYRSAAIANLAPNVALHGAYDYLDNGALNGFELEVLRSTGLMSLIELVAPDFLGDQYRNDLTDGLQMTHDLALDRRHRPRLIISHLISPHSPMVFDAQCGPRSSELYDTHEDIMAWLDANLEDNIEQRRQDYVSQTQCLNSLLIPLIDDIIEKSAEPPVMVLMSDHGPSLSDSPLDWYGNLFATYTPGHDDLFPEDATPINLFPTLLNAYLDTDYPLQANVSYRYDAPGKAWVEIPSVAP